ncbi:MAG: FAD-dependent oxidoreductase, partial [Chloroflexota bacterium]
QVWADWQVAFSQYCYQRYMGLEDEIGVSAGFRQTGTYTLVTEAVAEQEQALAETRRQVVANTDILSAEDMGERLPVVDSSQLAFGVYGEADGSIDTPTIMQGWRAAAERLGVTILEGQPATGIDVIDGRVRAVRTATGVISTRVVVNAAGADAAKVGGWAGIDIPIDNRVRNIFIMAHHPLLEGIPAFVQDAEDTWYFRRVDEGIMIGMGTRKDAPVQMAPDMDYWPAVRDLVAQRARPLAKLEVIGGWSGVRPLTPDHRPILGPVDGVEGFINDCGWGGEGIMHAPVGGQLTAEVIAYGATRTFDVAPFQLSRFASPVDAQGR